MLAKEELRKQIRTAKSQQDSAALAIWSQQICRKILSSINSSSFNPHPSLTLIAYYPLQDEVDIRHVIDTLYKKGVRVLLPKVTGDITMELRLYEGPESLKKGAFGILEAVGPIFHPSSSILHPSLALVPGMAFDRVGHRLGRGKGYYDRFLSRVDVYKIGVCFPFQLFDEVPSDEHDILMDEIISAG